MTDPYSDFDLVDGAIAATSLGVNSSSISALAFRIADQNKEIGSANLPVEVTTSSGKVI
ncbi:MAG TPA: hypothetical protein VFI70_09465 [Nitrososphaeraceae archaeon]|nr:hypothetical protein [Nitrososphaeraceae archaeon]